MIETIQDLFPTFIEGLAGQSPNNRRNYKLRLRRFLKLYGHLTPADLTPANINEWHTAIKSRGYQPATEAGYRQAVKTFCNWLVAEGRCLVSPAVHLRIGSFISKRRKLPNENDVQQCYNIAQSWLRSDNPRQIRDALIFLISYVSGARLKEVQQLRLDEVYASIRSGPDQAGAYWVRSQGKTGEVSLGYTADVAAGFQRWLRVRPSCKVNTCFLGLKPVTTKADPALRYRPLSRGGITDCYIRVSRAAGLERPILSHALRHRKGDKLTKQFGPKVAAMVLNHADADSAATAIAYYHHPDRADTSRALVAVDLVADDTERREINRLFGIV